MADTDGSLVARARLGDAAAFEALLGRHFRVAWLVALARVHNEADAEDVCQDAFVQAWEHLHACRDPDRFAAWLVRIVRNTALNRREYLRVRSADSLDSAAQVASTASADAAALRAELRARLRRALDRLSPVPRDVVLLHDLEGFRHAEIAERLGISELMSRRHLSDARGRLRELLGEYPTRESGHDR